MRRKCIYLYIPNDIYIYICGRDLSVVFGALDFYTIFRIPIYKRLRGYEPLCASEADALEEGFGFTAARRRSVSDHASDAIMFQGMGSMCPCCVSSTHTLATKGFRSMLLSTNTSLVELKQTAPLRRLCITTAIPLTQTILLPKCRMGCGGLVQDICGTTCRKKL